MRFWKNPRQVRSKSKDLSLLVLISSLQWPCK